MILLSVWFALMDMLVGILMAFMVFMKGMVEISGICKEDSYLSFAWRKNYVCQVYV